MRRVKPDETVVCEVTRPIEWMGARPGDRLYLRPSHPTHPVQLVRKLSSVSVDAVPFDSLRELSRERQRPGPQLVR